MPSKRVTLTELEQRIILHAMDSAFEEGTRRLENATQYIAEVGTRNIDPKFTWIVQTYPAKISATASILNKLRKGTV